MANFVDKHEVFLPKNINAELNFIEKGLISHKIDEILYFIYRYNDVDKAFYDNIDEVIMEFNPILRDEFPSVRMIIRFIDNKSEILSIDYYFSIESEQELEHLYCLSRSRYLNIIFNNSDTSDCYKFALNKDESQRINNIIEEIET
jgi:hypothetical protein